MIDKQATTPAARAAAGPPQRLLNVFALPSQTFILAAMIAAVIYGALAAISVNSPIGGFGLLIAALIVLSLRGLLAWPDYTLRKHNLRVAGSEYKPLQERIAALAAQNGIKWPVGLLLTSSDAGPEAVGGLRRRYIFLSQTLADDMISMVQASNRADSVDAVLLHELSHFRHGDNLWIGYTRFLLRSGVALIGWAALFLLGSAVFLRLAAFQMLQYSPAELAQRFEALLPGLGVGDIILLALGPAAEWEAMRQRVPEINMGLIAFFAFGNTFPLAAFSGGLLVFFWRRLMRLRELYADAAVVQIQREIAPLKNTIYLFAIPLDASKQNARHPPHRNSLGQNIKHMFNRVAQRIPGNRRARALWSRVFNTHYPGIRRLATLRDPILFYDGWLKTAVIIGAFILILELLLFGTSALFFIGNWPLHIFVLAAFVLISLNLMVRLVVGQPVLRDILKIIGVIMIPHSVLLILTLAALWVAVIVAPDVLAAFLDLSASFVAGFAGVAPDMVVRDPTQMVLLATILNLLQLPTIFLLTVGSLAVSTWALRRMLTWYGRFQSIPDWQWASYSALVLLTFVLAVGVLPPITDLILGRFADLLSLWRLLGMGLALLVVLGGGWWFWRQDQAYGRRCPHCGEQVPGHYYLGRECPAPTCGELLNPWLLVTYNVEPRRRRPPQATARPALYQERPNEQS
jgi:Zn-dependent protease with chaperone function